MIESNSSIRCQISAQSAKLTKELSHVFRACVVDTGIAHSIETVERVAIHRHVEPEILLKIPIGIAVSCDAIWHLACRIACFCPQARVSTSFENVA